MIDPPEPTAHKEDLVSVLGVTIKMMNVIIALRRGQLDLADKLMLETYEMQRDLLERLRDE
ncbi:hypothetical protein [Paracoccus sp. SY]|uniref:hypothetical protein n=1 Tax=Paracoccus sp. SY TaxID=1330255 RepID=UPI000CD1E98D|nr:hypothetical protein [Paracoccus sp. SY]